MISFSFIHLFVHFHYLFAKVEEKVFLIIMGNTGTCSFLFAGVLSFLFLLRVSLCSLFFQVQGLEAIFLPFTFFSLFFSFSYFLPFGF